MKRFCLTLDLRNDATLVERYIEHHRSVWPEVLQSIRDAGVLDMQIYHLAERLFMIMDTTDDFSFERKAALDLANPSVLAWEELMSLYQNVSPGSNPASRWRRMESIFQLQSSPEIAPQPAAPIESRV